MTLNVTSDADAELQVKIIYVISKGGCALGYFEHISQIFDKTSINIE